jgi:hypothetical protein
MLLHERLRVVGPVERLAGGVVARTGVIAANDEVRRACVTRAITTRTGDRARYRNSCARSRAARLRAVPPVRTLSHAARRSRHTARTMRMARLSNESIIVLGS